MAYVWMIKYVLWTKIATSGQLHRDRTRLHEIARLCPNNIEMHEREQQAIDQ